MIGIQRKKENNLAELKKRVTMEDLSFDPER